MLDDVRIARSPNMVSDLDRCAVPTSSDSEHVAAPAAKTRTRRLVAVLVAVATAVVLVTNRAEVSASWSVLRRADLRWVGILVVVTGLGLGVLVVQHTAAQRAAGLDPRLSRLASVALAARFLNSVTKSAGLAGLVVFRAKARREGKSLAGVAAAYLLVTVLDLLAFAVILATALAVLTVRGHFNPAEVAASVIFAAYLLVVLSAVFCAVRSRTAIRRLYAIPRRVLGRVRRARPSDTAGPDGVQRTADELFDAIAVVRRRGPAALPAGLAALTIDLLGVVQLWVVLRALRLHPTVTVALVAYAVSTLVGILGLLPAGLGFVEVSLGAVLVSLGVGVGAAAAAVVLYRFAEFWLPLAVGAVALHRVTRKTQRQ